MLETVEYLSTPRPSDAIARMALRLNFLMQKPFPVRISGEIVEARPETMTVAGLCEFAALGDRVMIETHTGSILAEIIRVDQTLAIVKAFTQDGGIGIGARVTLASGHACLYPCSQWKGRIIDALGQPADKAGPLPTGNRAMSHKNPAPDALTRNRVTKPVRTGVRAVDLFTPLCAGQRIGIFAGSGVGKSTLLGMLARAQGFDTIIVALVGERGREVREFIEDILGENRNRAVTIIATSDESAMMRAQAPQTALAVAEYFRDCGESVLLIVDSITRFAHAVRDIGLSAGEPPVARGYTPGVFSALPRLLERAGPGVLGRGSITGIFSVLIDGDDHNDPIADAVRGTVDGHIVLDRAISDQGRFPAINVLGSISRLALHCWSAEQQTLVRKLTAMIARYEDTRDLRQMGGYQPGIDPDLDHAVRMVPEIYLTLNQSPQNPPSRDAFRELAEALHGNTSNLATGFTPK